MSMPPVPQMMSPSGELKGARMPPTPMALCCFAPCAISGYENGDLTEGSMSGSALIPCICYFFYCLVGLPCISGIYAMLAWKPDPKNIKGDGTMRTMNNRVLAVCCVGGPCAIAFWQNGDACTDVCTGDPGQSCLLNLLSVGLAACGLGIGPIGDYWACCCWKPNPSMFRRTQGNGRDMDGSRPGTAHPAVVGVGQAVAQPMAVAVGVVVPATAVAVSATPVGNNPQLSA